MTDRINAFVVILDRDIRDDDVEAITNALRMVKHVASVEPVVARSTEGMVARTRVSKWWRDKLFAIIDEAPR